MRVYATLVPLMLGGCYPDISGTLDPGPAQSGGRVQVTPAEEGDGFTLIVDATSYDDWVAFDLDTMASTDEADPGWDLAARRFEIKLNGGISGEGGVEAASVELPFDAVTEAPADGWRSDLEDADDDDVPEYALAEWYIYDYGSHTLSPSEITYVVRSTASRFYKIRFDGYYDDEGTPALISLTVAELPE